MLTPQQTKAVGMFAKGNSIAIQAVAGSGKTTTLVAALSNVSAEGICIAFNKRVAKELGAKLPDNISARTFNSIGHLAWLQHIRKVPVLDERKLWNLWNDYKKRQEYTDEQAKAVVALVNAAKTYGLMPAMPPLRGASTEEWLELAQLKDIDEAELLLEPAQALLVENCKLGFAGTIDFNDQIYLPNIFNAPFSKYAVVGVDEAQDLSALQHRMVEKSLAIGGQIVTAGDRNQAIYSWRGAESNSFDQLSQRFNLLPAPLTLSFRCPRAVVREAQRYVPEMEAASEKEGEVVMVGEPLPPTKSIAFLCRTNAPLISLAFRGLRQGIPVNYLGRDFTAGLRSLHKLCPTEEHLAVWLADKLKNSKNAAAKQRAKDRADSLATIFRQAEHSGRSVASALAELGSANSPNAMTLSTIHRSKGLEWSEVVYMDYANQWKGDQEQNIRYVGVTRAKERLFLELLPEHRYKGEAL